MDDGAHSWTLLLFILLFFSFPAWLQSDNPLVQEATSHSSQGVDSGKESNTGEPLFMDDAQHQEPATQLQEDLTVDANVETLSVMIKENNEVAPLPEDVDIIKPPKDTTVVDVVTSNTIKVDDDMKLNSPQGPTSEDIEGEVRDDTARVVENKQPSSIDRPCFPADQKSEEEKYKEDDKQVEERENIEQLKDKEEGKTVEEVAEETTEEQKVSVDEDDMPPFDEWKKKKMAEMEQGRKQVLTPSNGQDRGLGSGGQGSTSGQSRHFNLSQNSKNHGSADCGAKILSSNPEAHSASAILMQNRDVYMLNPCSAKIWFTVELCEPLQIKQIEIANFELFSSTPKTFRVHISDRYQSRDWHYLGTFHALDQRTLQSFTIQNEGMFTKYLKVEMVDFFGSEHYCPLSIIRVFGTSMEEEIIEDSNIIANPLDEVVDDLVPGEGLKKANLLDSAIDAVNHVVKRAAKALLGSEDKNPTNCSENITDNDLHDMRPCMPEDDPNITTKGHAANKGCFPEVPVPLVVDIPGERAATLQIRWIDYLNELCDPCTYCHNCDYSDYLPVCNYVKYMKAHYPVTCKQFIAKKPIPKKVKHINKKDDIPISSDTKESRSESVKSVEVSVVVLTTSMDTVTDSTHATLIQPTKTTIQVTSSDDTIADVKTTTSIKNTVQDNLQGSVDSHPIHTVSAHSSDEVLIEPSSPASLGTNVGTAPVMMKPLDPTEVTHAEVFQTTAIDSASTVQTITPTASVPIGESATRANDVKIIPEEVAPLTEFYAEDGSEMPLSEQSKGGAVLPSSKESIFMRLNNRIKNLEYNMSLSQQYLQELSQRYRKLMDDMQKSFNKTVGKLTNHSKFAEEKDQKQQDTINNMGIQLDRLTTLVQDVSIEMKDVQHKMIERHFFLMLMEVLFLSLLFVFCTSRQRRHVYDLTPDPPEILIASPTKKMSNLKRRNSADGTIGHTRLELDRIKVKKKHHDDANISITGDYRELLIVEPTKPLLDVLKKTEVRDIVKHPKKQKSKVKGRCRAGSASSFEEFKPPHNGHLHHKTTNISSAGLIFSGRGSLKSNSSVQCNGGGKNGSFDRVETLYDTGTVDPMRQNTHPPLPHSKNRKGSHAKKKKVPTATLR